MKRTLILTALTVSLLLSAQPLLTSGRELLTPDGSASCPGFALAVDSDKAQSVDAMLRTRWEKPNGPGAEVIVLQNGKVKFLSGYGLADIRRQTPINERIVFNLASVSKQFTAVAIMKLVEKGKLSLDDSLTSLLPKFKSLKDAERIKVRHLLTHTSGLPSYLDIFGANGERLRPGFMPANSDVIDALTGRRRLTFTPGSQFKYSNSGYVVLAQIVEARSGMRFADFMKQTFFVPLGMRNTFVMDERPVNISNHASAYDKAANGFRDVTRSPLDSICGDGNVHSTICDLAKWLQELLNIYTGRPTSLSPILISRSSLDQVFTQVVTDNDSTITYGFGWAVFHTADLKKARDRVDDDFRNVELVMHRGVWRGVRTFIGILPRRGDGTIGILLSNSGEFDPCDEADRVAKEYLRDIPSIPRFIPDCRDLN